MAGKMLRLNVLGKLKSATSASWSDVVRNPKPKFRPPYKRQDIQGKVPNYPPHIAAHLQGTQNPPHKSQPCKRAAIANTQQKVLQFKTKNTKKKKRKAA